jgi:hypothetical protein
MMMVMSAKERDRLSGRRWEVEVGGLPCTIEFENGEWVVTLAEVSIAQSENLDAAIRRACGGLVSASEALELALSVREGQGR